MIVNLQNPVIQNRNTNQNNLKQRTSINTTSLNQDSFVSRKTNDNIAFGRSFMSGITNSIVTTKFEQKMDVIEKIIIKAEIDKLKEILPTGGTRAHHIAEKFDFKQVENTLEILQNKPEVYIDICKIRKPQASSSELIHSDDGLTLIDIIENRALSVKKEVEVQKWDELTALMILSLENYPKQLKQIFPSNSQNLAEAIIGLKNLDNKHIMLEKTIQSIAQVFKKNPDHYTEILSFKEKKTHSTMQIAFEYGNDVVDIITKDIPDRYKVFDKAASKCDDLKLALKMNQYFMSKNGNEYEHSIKAIANALYKDSKNSYKQWDSLKRSEKQEIKDAVETLIKNNKIGNSDKLTLLDLMPEFTKTMQIQYRSLSGLS